MSLQPDTPDQRAATLQQDGLLIGIAGTSLLGGMSTSPYFDPAFILVKFLLAPAFFISSPILIYYFTSLLVSVVCLIVAGVPAAIFERVTKRKQSDTASLLVWFVSLFILVLPVLLGWSS